MKLEIAAIEKKAAHFLDSIVESDSSTVIGAYERKVDELERKKLVMLEKTSRCGTAVRGYDETFRTASEFLGNYGPPEILKINVSSKIGSGRSFGIRLE